MANSANAEARPDLVALYLKSAVVSGKQNLFFVGPFGRRVSFASQQRRALNVVWAVGKLEPYTADMRVAVVGGGIAGLTACAALISKGCQVVLFEREARVLKRQMQTTHRFVHPTINFWPEKPLSSSTEFPYLDWHEGTCAEVVASIAQEWREYFEGGLVERRYQSEVTGVVCADSGVTLTYEVTQERADKRIETDEFHKVFVTTGFGDEVTLLQDDKSYWDEDYIEDKIHNGQKDFVIGGIGDGGLIEALRVLQKNFNKGAISLKAAQILTSTTRADLVLKIESEVNGASRTDDDAAEMYFAKYSSLVGTFPDNLKTLLDDVRTDVSVQLVGTLKAPFGKHVAPIHKAMIAYAMKTDQVKYVVGRLKAEVEKPYIKRRGRRKEIDDTVKVITRVGPKHPLGAFLSDEELDHLRDAQQSLADILDPAPIDIDFFPGYRKFPKRDVTCKKFAKLRKKQVDNYLFERFNAKSRLTIETSGISYQMVVDQDASEPEEFAMPQNLFGFPVTTDASTATHL